METHGPRMKAQAEREFWQALERAKELQDVMVSMNVRESETKNALWYFQMYGPANKKVMFDTTVKDGKGGSKSVRKEIGQTFHDHMLATDDFGEALTLRLEGNTSEGTTPSETTMGVENQVQGITEPQYEESSKYNLWGATSYLWGFSAYQFTNSLWELAKSGVVDMDTIDDLEKKLKAYSDGEHKKSAVYMLKVLRIAPLVQAKTVQMQRRAQTFTELKPARLKELAIVSPRQARAIEKLLGSKVVSNFKNDVDFYENASNNVASHKAYNTLFPPEYQKRMKQLVKAMKKELKNLSDTVVGVQQQLSEK
jgi:hypothetical protein